jgi:hypothetical protein
MGRLPANAERQRAIAPKIRTIRTALTPGAHDTGGRIDFPPSEFGVLSGPARWRAGLWQAHNDHDEQDGLFEPVQSDFF